MTEAVSILALALLVTIGAFLAAGALLLGAVAVLDVWNGRGGRS